MTALENVQNMIERHQEMHRDWYCQDAWYRNSTAGRRQKAMYEYALEVLESIRDCSER